MISVTSCDKEQDLPADTFRCQVPFPNHTAYISNHIKPDNYSQSELDNQTGSFYTAWKKDMLKAVVRRVNFMYIAVTGQSSDLKHTAME
jgi:hypothetical protein